MNLAHFSLRFACRSVFTASSLRMPIKVGDTLPSVEVSEGVPDTKINIKDIFAGKKGILIAVPGAFTPYCSETHLPGYVQDYEKFKGEGVEVIACISINDAYVMDSWGKDQKAKGKVRMLADTNGDFTKAVDLGIELEGLGGLRSKRYSMVIQDGVVKSLNVEPDGFGLTCTLSNKLTFQF